MTGLEVLDSAVKIGLGALIAGLSTFFIGSRQHVRELEKERIKREFEVLKQTAEQIELFTHVALKYWALIVEWGRFRRTDRPVPESRANALEACISELFSSFKEMSNAEAKLLLLGYKSAQVKSRIYGELVTSFRREVNRDSSPLTEDQAQAWRTRLLGAREELFDELSSCYRKLSP
ncbi:hypothetical protein [Pseudomonas viridiflava]|uniref:hypothetical protein n=1 Tax=Pseudomonas viridiflava TaxID=33069 RepID=UPI000F015DE0|nr:hypothetical protein [Pseudomonas viridiflava]